MRKMRGVIDPYTLGFLISLIGGTTAYVAHQDVPQDTAQATHEVVTDSATDVQTQEDDALFD